MKKLKLFFALFAMLALGVGNAWGAEATITFSEKRLVNGTQYLDPFTIDANTTITFAGGDNDGKYYTTGTGIRTYANGTITVECTNGTISEISFTWSGTNNTYKPTDDVATPAGYSTSTGKWTGSASSVTLTRPSGSGHWRLQGVSVAYEAAGSGETPDPTPDPEEPDPTPDPGTGSTSGWVETAIADITASDIVVITMSKGGTTYALTSANGSSAAPTAVIVTVNGDKLAAEPTDVLKWNIATSGTGYIIYPNGINNKYLYCTNTNNGVRVGTGDAKVFTINSGYLYTNQTTDARHIGVYNAQDWRCYKPSSGAIATNISDQTLKFYKYVAPSSGGGDEPEPEKTATSLAWSQTEYTVTMGETTTFPTLTTTPADLTGVTYSSSNETVATIAEDGTITIKAAGETTIKASYAGNEIYAAATDATYKLTVNKAPATETENVYVKVTSTEGITNGEYLIVYEDAANNPQSPVAFNGALTTLDAVSNNIAVAISSNTIAGNTDIDAATFTIDATAKTVKSKSGYYIGQTSDANGLKANNSTKYENALSIENDGTATIKSGGAYLRYNSDANNWRFRYYKSSSYSGQKAIALYKKASSHTLTYGTCTNGSVSANVADGATVLSGTTITLSNTPTTDYKLAVYDVYKTDDNTTKVTVTDDTFIMPEFDVTISATFVPAKTLTSIEITSAATQTTFWQGETFNYTGLEVTAHFDGAADEVVTPTVTGSTATAGTQIVTVSYEEGAVSKDATYTITVKAIPNTKETAYSVADAYDIIDKLGTASGVFISGIISQVDSYNSTYKSITYWISADGTTTNQLQAYSGKGLESADFSGKTDLSVGDQVIVCGNLKKYSGTYEFDKNNYLAEHTKTTKDPAGLAYATTSYTANVGEAFTTPELTNPHNLVVTYSTSDASKATVDANSGAVTIVAAGVVTITAATTGDASHDAGSASYTITITDPSLLIATLPFEFNGKQADIEGTAGMTHSGIDADDYKSAPYLKMNTTGDWLIICFDSEPEKLSYDIKNNSFSGGTFSVQESADGETYTDVKVHTEITETQNEEHTLLSTSRYVKFIYTEKSSGNVGLGNIKITKPDTREEAGLTWDPSSVTLTQGDAFTAPTLQNPKSVAGITYESNNDEVATVTAEGEIALGSATGTATITATFAGDATTYKPATATCTITVNEYIETIDGEWELVTDASKLQAGMEIIIASVEVDGKYYTMSKASDNGNNRTAVESTISGKKLNPAVGTSVLTLVDAGNGTFALQAGNGNYLYAASSSANQLKEKNKIDAHGQWTITIADNKATIKAEGSSNRNWMQFNPNNGSPLFSCYAYDKPQKDIALYKRMPDYTREVDPQYYGTICLPKAGKFVGGSLYEVAYYDETTKKVYFDEVLNGEMGAGMPYVFLANATKIEAYYTNDEEAAAQNKNGLCGTLVDITSGMNEDGVYMIYRNQIIHSTHSGSYLNANRAYIKLTEVPGYNDPLYVALAPAPGRKRIAIGQAPQVATGVDQVQGDNVPTKMIVNGQLFILRGEKMYDAQGKLVK